MNAIKRLREKKNANLVKACASQSAGNDYCVLLLFFVFFIFVFFLLIFGSFSCPMNGRRAARMTHRTPPIGSWRSHNPQKKKCGKGQGKVPEIKRNQNLFLTYWVCVCVCVCASYLSCRSIFFIYLFFIFLTATFFFGRWQWKLRNDSIENGTLWSSWQSE